MENLSTHYLKEKSSVDKENAAMVAVKVHYTSSLQNIMMESGFPHTEWPVHRPTFLKFMHLSLLDAAERIYALRQSSSVGTILFEDEKIECLDLLRNEIFAIFNSDDDDVVVDPRLMEQARKTSNDNLPQYLKNIMDKNGFTKAEKQDTHECFLSFYSNFLISETEKLLRYLEPIISRNNDAQADSDDEMKIKPKRQFTNQPSKTLDDGKEYIPVDESRKILSNHTLILSTKNHHIFHVSTPFGIRVLKSLRSDSSTSTIKNINALNNEFEVSKKMSHYFLRKAFAKTIFQGKNALLLEYVPGVPIDQVGVFNIASFLKTARDIVSLLLKFHENNIFHLNLTCDHILYDQTSNSIKIIGVGSSTYFRSKKSYVCASELLERDLHFIAPEQTGRVNRNIDQRTDYYSLGVIFYKLLCGKYPFDNNDDAFLLIHMHILQEAVPLHSTSKNIPLPISNMVSKLLRKSADDRYQSTKGVMYDIDLFASEYQSMANSGDFNVDIAQHDIADTPFIPQNLYGRATESNTLLTVMNRVVSLSSFELVLLQGNSGIGKSDLVMDMYQSIAPGGVFIHGKYDFFRTKPYSGIIEAMEMFCVDLSLKNQFITRGYRSLILDAVGDEGKLLTNIIENLHDVIGEQPEVSDKHGNEAKNRLNYVFTSFIKAIASNSKPLILVLEDLQWIDAASIELLKALVKNKVKNVMLVGVYRDKNGICDTQKPQLEGFLNFVEETGVTPTEIMLDDLHHESVNDLISDTLCISSLESHPLTAYVHSKTKGNPLFVKEMLKSLFENKKITFNYDMHKWQWDKSIYETKGVAENVRDHLRQKVQSSSKYTRQTLKIATCLGRYFSLSILYKVIGDKQGVDEALSSGMIIHYKENDMYCFVHDQVQLAAKSLLPKDPKPIYMYIARKLLKNFTKSEFADNICFLAHLFRASKNLIKDNERLNIAELMQAGGELEMISLSYDQALQYFETGIELLDENCWKENHELSVKIHCNAAKSAFCMANYGRMNVFIKKILDNATTLKEALPAYTIMVQYYSYTNKHQEATVAALDVLNKLGESINLRQNQHLAEIEIMKAKSLGGLSIDRVIDLPVADNSTLLLKMEFLNAILFSAYHMDPSLFVVLASRMVQLTILCGISKYSCMGFCSIGVALVGKKDRAAYDYGQLSLQLLEKVKAKELVPWVNSLFYSQIYPWYASVHDSISVLAKMTCISLETGSHESSIICSDTFCQRSFCCGKSLTKLKDDIEEARLLLPRETNILKFVYQATCKLVDEEANVSNILSDKDFDISLFLETEKKRFDIASISVMASTLTFLFYDYDRTSDMIEIVRTLQNSFVRTSYFWPLFYLYQGLLSLHFVGLGVEVNKNLETAKQNIQYFKTLCNHAPENFLHKCHLLEAEFAAVHKNESEAIMHYREAISLSRKYNFIHEEALVCERAGMFYLELGLKDEALPLLLQSQCCYNSWGATAKVNHLKKNYPFLSGNLADHQPTKLDSLEVTHKSEDSVSMMTDDSSSLSIWRTQKNMRCAAEETVRNKNSH